MRAYLAFSCLLAAVSARPDVSLGYRYPSPGGINEGIGPSGTVNVPSGLYAPSYGSDGGTGFLGGGSHGVGGGFLGSGSSFSGSGFSSVPAFNGGLSGGGIGFGGGSNGGIGFGGGSLGGGGGGASGYHGHGGFGAPIITKHFYVHAAPEEQADAVTKHFTIGRPQKNYRVVFIKAPASNGGAARISASYAPTEEKTVIYVLAKKPDELQIGDIATPAPTEPSKPEVFFIKYKTPQEAAHAQQQIQAQYDALGGTSQLTDEGTSQVSSVIGVLGGGGGGGHIGGGGIGVIDGSGSGPGSSKYLPPNH